MKRILNSRAYAIPVLVRGNGYGRGDYSAGAQSKTHRTFKGTAASGA
jgi:hypothetical protein